jgi:hypothetical protein
MRTPMNLYMKRFERLLVIGEKPNRDKKDARWLCKCDCGIEKFIFTYYGKYVYNGIDRLDNTKGYTIDNIVPCCYKCNVLKKDFTIDSMVKVLSKLGYEIGVGI